MSWSHSKTLECQQSVYLMILISIWGRLIRNSWRKRINSMKWMVYLHRAIMRSVVNTGTWFIINHILLTSTLVLTLIQVTVKMEVEKRAPVKTDSIQLKASTSLVSTMNFLQETVTTSNSISEYHHQACQAGVHRIQITKCLPHSVTGLQSKVILFWSN